jgi:hypothetical protein
MHFSNFYYILRESNDPNEFQVVDIALSLVKHNYILANMIKNKKNRLLGQLHTAMRLIREEISDAQYIIEESGEGKKNYSIKKHSRATSRFWFC